MVRVVVGALIAGHGLQKVAGWFGGPGVNGHAEALRSLGYRRPRTLSWVHGVAETAGGVLLAVGLLTPLAAAAILAVMLNAAVVVHARNGLWVQQGGYEYPLVLAALSAGIALTGPGAFALDAITGWDLTGVWAAAGIIGGLAVGAAVLAVRQQPQPADQHGSERQDPSERPGTPAHAA